MLRRPSVFVAGLLLIVALDTRTYFINVLSQVISLSLKHFSMLRQILPIQGVQSFGVLSRVGRGRRQALTLTTGLNRTVKCYIFPYAQKSKIAGLFSCWAAFGTRENYRLKLDSKHWWKLSCSTLNYKSCHIIYATITGAEYSGQTHCSQI